MVNNWILQSVPGIGGRGLKSFFLGRCCGYHILSQRLKRDVRRVVGNTASVLFFLRVAILGYLTRRLVTDLVHSFWFFAGDLTLILQQSPPEPRLLLNLQILYV